MCNRNFSLDSEPDVQCFDGYSCTGSAFNLGVGDQAAPWPYGGSFGGNMISSCYVPPNKSLTVYTMPSYQGWNLGMGPGFYGSLQAGFDNTINSLKVTKTQAWADTVTDCCTKTKTQGQCPGLPYGP